MIFLFKIKIEYISDPPVWRRVEVPASLTFLQFHQVIQTIFSWGNSHLWNFEPRTKSRRQSPAFHIEEPYFGQECFDYTTPMIASDTTLDRIFPSEKELIYTYDYGDGWVHTIKLEGITEENRAYAVCTKGKGTTPPEDCGGVGGYFNLKKAFENRDKEQMDFYRDWLYLDDDEIWNPDSFCAETLNAINTKLKQIKAPVGEIEQTDVTKPFESAYTCHPSYYSVQELLNRKTVVELRHMASLLGIRFKAGVKKGTMLDIIADRMINRPETLIRAAFYYELKAFIDIINGKMTLEYADESELLYELNRFGLIYALDFHRDNISTLNFQMDLADILKPLIPAELERRERNGALLFEKLALGCANIYGYTEMYYLQDFIPVVEERTGFRFNDPNTLTDAIYPVIAAIDSGNRKEKHILLSPFAKNIGFYPDEEHIRFEIEPKKHHFDTTLDYGEMPYPKFSGKEADKLREIIGKYGCSGTNPDAVLRRMWLNHQNVERSNPFNDLGFLDLPDMSALQPCLDAVTDFSNNVPCWKLRGNSSMEIAKIELASPKNGTPRISMGPNMRAMGIDSFEQLISMACNGEDIPQHPFPTSGKVGRNDPCPCGSGKKYKHCCGRN